MIKFNDNNIYVGYIKQLLKDFNLPRCQVYDEEKSVYYKVFDYNNKNKDFTVFIKNKSLCRLAKKNNEIFEEELLTYNFNDKIKNLTDNLHIKSNIYDSDTHKYLGDFLRFIRDYTGLDLMQMYNCFTNESPVNLVIKDFNIDSSDYNYQLYILPIKFNKVYTIGLDCSSKVTLVTCNYENKDIVNTKIPNTFKHVSGSKFNKPFLFESPKVSSTDMLVNEDTLKLIIKIPSSCRSSIVVLEGDYTRGCDLFNTGDRQILASTCSTEMVDNNLFKYMIESGKDVNKEILVNYYISRPQLLYLNTEQCYLLADRLLEYLSRNTIDSNEEIEDNIKALQREISSYNFKMKYLNGHSYIPDFYGAWDNAIREALYNYVYKSTETGDRTKVLNNYFDMLGYYDKDIEYRLHSYDNDEDKSYKM